jgi:DNA-binding transcriptional regulator WhiA
MNDIDSYIYGLFITDGSLNLTTRNRGKITLEVNEKDEDIIYKLYNIIPNSKVHERTRNTNFKKNYKSKIFSNHQRSFREKFIRYGFPTKNKTLSADVPKEEYNEISFWRGIIDGDGSLGFIKDGSPFVSLVTKSEFLKDKYLIFLNKFLGITKHLKRNKRDQVYNIIVKNEEAVKLSKMLYLTEKTDLYINRKYFKAMELQSWVRKVPRRFKEK